MRLRRTAVAVSLVAAGMTAAAVGLPAPAYASVQDTGVWFHVQGWDDGKCLYDPNTGVLEVYKCENTPYERWDTGPNPTNHMQLINQATGHCAEPARPGGNRTAIIMVTCDRNDPRQFWDNYTIVGNSEGSLNRLKSVDGYCMDRPTEVDYDGEHMQMWECQGEASFPDWDEHYEQSPDFTQHIG